MVRRPIGGQKVDKEKMRSGGKPGRENRGEIYPIGCGSGEVKENKEERREEEG